MNRFFLTAFTFLILTGTSFAADSTGSPSGTAKQPDLNQRGSNIIEVGTLEAGTVDADSAAISGQIKSGSVNTGSISADSVNSSGTVLAPSGAITNLNTNRTYVQRTPTSPVDATNKAYVDGRYNTLSANQDSLSARISALESSSGSSSNCPSGYSAQFVKALSQTGSTIRWWTGTICVKNYKNYSDSTGEHR